jgi:hypothetical protein
MLIIKIGANVSPILREVGRKRMSAVRRLAAAHR